MPGRSRTGIHRIPLPLPMDGLKAINVYVIEHRRRTDADRRRLVDPGGARAARAVPALDRLRLRRHPPVPGHPHPPRPLHDGDGAGPRVRRRRRARPRREAGARPAPPRARRALREPVRASAPSPPARPTSPSSGTRAARTSELPGPDAVAVPRHLARRRPRDPRRRRGPSTPFTRPATRPATTCSPTGPTGCCSPATTCCRRSRPSIGFTVPPTPQPLGDFMASLTKVRALPDLRILPAHGPVAPSSHTRVDELLAFHEKRLERCLAALAGGPLNSAEVAAPPRLDPARARVRRARRLQPGHGRDGDQGAPRAARRARRGHPVRGRRRGGDFRDGGIVRDICVGRIAD